MEPHRKGDATEAITIAELERRGIPVLTPFGDNERYDLVAETPRGELVRLQVKTGRLTDGVVKFKTKSSHTNSQGNVYKSYEGDIDYFLVYSYELDELYLVEGDAAVSNVSLRVEEPDQPDPKINPAEAYAFDERWPPDAADAATPSTGPDLRQRRSDARASVAATLDDIGVAAVEAPDGEPADLVAWTADDRPVRLSVYTATGRDGRLRLVRDVEGGAGDGNGRDGTGRTAVDAFVLHDHDRDRSYLLEPHQVETTVDLWIDEPEEIRGTTRFAADHDLREAWPPTGLPAPSSRSPVGRVADTFDALGVPAAHVVDEGLPYDLLVAEYEPSAPAPSAREPGERTDASDPGDDGATDADPDASPDAARVAVEPAWPSGGCLRLKPRPDVAESADAFVVYHRDADACYAVAADVFDRSISLRVEPPAQSDPSIRWASDYALADGWPP